MFKTEETPLALHPASAKPAMAEKDKTRKALLIFYFFMIGPSSFALNFLKLHVTMQINARSLAQSEVKIWI